MARKPHYPNYVKALPARCKEMKPFIVVDMETILINDIHVPCAASYFIVYPGDDIAAMPDYATANECTQPGAGPPLQFT
jgi:hypothetical protein